MTFCIRAHQWFPMKILHIILALWLTVAFSACARKPADGESTGHEHRAPHGGTLIELGDHAYNIELVRDDAAGRLTAYVLDGHAENFIRLKIPSIELIAMPGGTFTPVSLRAVASTATGETVGDTSQFVGMAEWLKTAGDFSGIFSVEIRGTRYEQVEYTLPK
jgi:hypothetical protein